MAGPSQPQVIDEVWSDDRIRSFLDTEAHGDFSADHTTLLRAYRGMRADDFARFLAMYHAAGRDLDATDPDGQTLWSVIANHRHGAVYLEAVNVIRG